MDNVDAISLYEAIGKTEVEKAREAWQMGNDGRSRACIRRAIGAFVKIYELTQPPLPGNTSVEKLRAISDRETIPIPVREAARRLTTNVKDRLTTAFSLNPMLDGQVVITFLLAQRKDLP